MAGFLNLRDGGGFCVEAAGDKFLRRGPVARGIAVYVAGRAGTAISNR